jgi:hypothetical protein
MERSRAAGGLVKTARANAQQLAVDRMNAALSRIRMARHPEFFQKLRWTLQRDSAEGHANWRLAGQLLAFCLERLVPLQNELGLIRAVHLDSQREHFDLPAKRR